MNTSTQAPLAPAGVCQKAVDASVRWAMGQDIKELMPDVHKSFHHFTGRAERAVWGELEPKVGQGVWSHGLV